jgi:two-component system response regulator (stage 0 sporulation protein A)
MGKKKLLIVDDNKNWCELLKKEADASGFFEVAFPVYDGNAAIEYISANRPDAIVLDMLVPEYDGLYIINYLRNDMAGYDPFIYVVSTIGFSNAKRVMNGLNVGYYSIKPIQEKAVVSNLRSLLEGDDEPAVEAKPAQNADAPQKTVSINLDKFIDDYLYRLGVPLYRLSTQCMHIALRYCLSDESRLGNLSNLFAEAASKMTPALTYRAFDRNVRSVAANVLKASTPYFEECFPDKSKKLTTTYFIDMSVYIIRAKIEESLSD